MSNDILEFLGKSRPPELDRLNNGPVSPGSALHEALGSSEYWFQKYTSLEKAILEAGLRTRKVKQINKTMVIGFVIVFFSSTFSTYQAIRYRHKAEALEVQIHHLQQNP